MTKAQKLYLSIFYEARILAFDRKKSMLKQMLSKEFNFDELEVMTFGEFQKLALQNRKAALYLEYKYMPGLAGMFLKLMKQENKTDDFATAYLDNVDAMLLSNDPKVNPLMSFDIAKSSNVQNDSHMWNRMGQRLGQYAKAAAYRQDDHGLEHSSMITPKGANWDKTPKVSSLNKTNIITGDELGDTLHSEDNHAEMETLNATLDSWLKSLTKEDFQLMKRIMANDATIKLKDRNRLKAAFQSYAGLI